MQYHNILTQKTKRLTKDIIEQQMSYQLKGGFYEEIQKIKVFKKIGIDSKTQHGKQLLRKRVKKEWIEKHNKNYNHEEI